MRKRYEAIKITEKEGMQASSCDHFSSMIHLHKLSGRGI